MSDCRSEWFNRRVLLDELRRLIIRHGRGGETHVVNRLDRVLLSTVTKPGPPTTSSTGTTLAVIAQGEKTLMLGDRSYRYRAGQYLVASIDLPVTGQFTEASPDRPALGFGLTLNPSVLADLLLTGTPADPATDRRDPVPSAVAVSDAPDLLLDAVVRLLRLIDRPRDLPVLAPLIEREIHWLLMTGDQGVTVRELGLADSRLNRIGQTVRWIRDHYAESVRVDELARYAGFSASALHRNFRAATAMSPIQFQKQIRLQEARLLLITEPDDVAGAAYAVGYQSPSQFSRDYRRQYGLSPTHDARRVRETADR